MTINFYTELVKKDKTYLWHPFTQMKDWFKEDPVIIKKGEGVKLIDVQGKSYYDGVSSIWLNVHGHQIPAIDLAIQEQLKNVAHSTLLGASNIPAIQLAEKLVRITPESLQRVFYSDNGSSAVEIAIKIAYQYWQHKGETKRRFFISMHNAYHGDTLGSVSVGGMELFHNTFKDLLFPCFQVPYPYPYRFNGSIDDCINDSLQCLEHLCTQYGKQITGLIVEPVVQGASGIIVMPDGFMKELASRCRAYDILLITDEVATGFGRTGRMFACEYDTVQPDILTIGKGLTGGYLPLAATLTSEDIFSAFLGDYNEKKSFFHGHSYTGNPLACSAALANLHLFEERDLIRKIQEKSGKIERLLTPLRSHPHVGDIRGKGWMWGIELVRDKKTKASFKWEEKIGIKVCQRSRELGMILRPLGNVIVFMPPLASSVNDLEEMSMILKQAIEESL